MSTRRAEVFGRAMPAMPPSHPSPQGLENFLFDIWSIPTSEKVTFHFCFLIILPPRSSLEMLFRRSTLLLLWQSDAKIGNLKLHFSKRAYLPRADRPLHFTVQPGHLASVSSMSLSCILKVLFPWEASSKLHCIWNETLWARTLKCYYNCRCCKIDVLYNKILFFHESFMLISST